MWVYFGALAPFLAVALDVKVDPSGQVAVFNDENFPLSTFLDFSPGRNDNNPVRAYRHTPLLV